MLPAAQLPSCHVVSTCIAMSNMSKRTHSCPLPGAQAQIAAEARAGQCRLLRYAPRAVLANRSPAIDIYPGPWASVSNLRTVVRNNGSHDENSPGVRSPADRRLRMRT